MRDNKGVLFFSYEVDRRVAASELIESAGYGCVTAACLEEALALLFMGCFESTIIDACVRNEDRKVLRTECESVHLPVLDLGGPLLSSVNNGQRLPLS